MFQLDILFDISILPSNIMDVKLAKSSKHNQSSSSSTIPKSTSTVTSNNTTEKNISVPFNSSVAENKKIYIIDTLNNWCENNKSKLNVQQFSLVEGEHYFILLQNDSNGAL
ncbi:unnamed protein product, partial [Rotaria magnacalcarata]